jgi:phosphoglycerate dehydrogenase-like enzyme
MAILDDYNNIALKHFTNISPNLQITTYNTPFPTATPDDIDALAKTLKPYTLLSTMRERTPLPGTLLRQLPNLKVIFATGGHFSSFDLQTAKALGIRIVTAPGKGRTDGKGSGPLPRSKLDVRNGGGHPTVQHVWALILALARNVAADDYVLKNVPGGWQTDIAIGLQGKTLGVVGFGRIGALVARIACLAWGMRVLCWSENLTQERADAFAAEMGVGVTGAGFAEEDEKSFLVVSKEELFRKADVVTVHYALSERSRGIVGEKELGWMKREADFVNTARGPLVDEQALLRTLREGRIRGAALDVFDLEPLPADSPWRTEKWGVEGKSRVLLTPHMGYVEEGTLNLWYEEQAENVERWVAGNELLNVVV